MVGPCSTGHVTCPNCGHARFKDIWISTDGFVTLSCITKACNTVFNVCIDDIEPDGSVGCGVVFGGMS